MNYSAEPMIGKPIADTAKRLCIKGMKEFQFMKKSNDDKKHPNIWIVALLIGAVLLIMTLIRKAFFLNDEQYVLLTSAFCGLCLVACVVMIALRIKKKEFKFSLNNVLTIVAVVLLFISIALRLLNI